MEKGSSFSKGIFPPPYVWWLAGRLVTLHTRYFLFICPQWVTSTFRPAVGQHGVTGNGGSESPAPTFPRTPRPPPLNNELFAEQGCEQTPCECMREATVTQEIFQMCTPCAPTSL